ncbi:MAG TPA: dihydroorotase [Thermoanaerobacterales bacterium]|nr:dihydroorotase [Thermoanaerobacterales bacterium]
MTNGTKLIKNGTIVNSRGEFKGNILIKNGKIAALLDPEIQIEADEVIDAGGNFIIPGGVDTHTHMMDPGHTEREDFTTGTMAAAYGGITTVIDHHRTVPPVYSVKELEEKIQYLRDKAVVDFGLKGGGSPDNVDKLKDMWDAGVTGFKMFTCDLHGVKAMLPGNLYNTFRELRRIGGIALIHCEDNSITSLNEERLKKEGRNDYLSQCEWRSALAERIAVETVIAVAKETGARVVIAHVSQPVLLEKIKEARDEGYPIYAESCPHYFYLTVEDLEKKGPWVKFTPPMKTKEDVAKMWELFNKGYVTTIGSDHCPYPKEDKIPGEKNIWDAPNGIPGVETSMRLMLNAVSEGKTTLNRIVETMCENPAKIYGLYPKKGAIEIGADADIVILDMEKEEALSNDRVISKCGWTPYDGMKIKGVPALVMVRGQVVTKDGKVLGKPGMGQFVPRQK